MKKLLFILLLLPFFGLSQTTGYLRYDSVKIMKQNGNSNLIIENATRGLTNSFLQNYSEGRTKFAYALDSVWQDGDSIRFRYGTTTIAVPATGGSISPTACNEIIEPGAVVYTGTGLNFYITPATYRIDCIEYTSDSVSFTLDPADGTFDRFDRFYLDATGAHVVTGTPAESPLIPQLPSSSLDLTSVQIDAGATTPDLVTSIVYDENTESVVTNFGTTTDGGQTTTVYKGTFATEVTNIVNGEYIEFTKTSGAWDVSTMDQFSLFFRLKQILGAATYIKVSLWNGTTLLSNEVAIGFNKNAINQWQGAAFPMSLFGNITNTLVTKVRFRYQTSTGATHPGFFFDWITFVDGLSSPGPGGNINLTLNMPPAFTVSPFNTVVNNGVWNVTMPGTQGQYLRGDGTVGTKDWITKIGAVDNYDRVPNGMQISGDTLYGQTADTTNVGFLGAYDWRRFDSTARMTVENVGDGDSVMVNLDAFRTAFKTLKEGTGVTFDITDTTITVNSSGGGAALIPTNGTGTATGNATGDLAGNEYLLKSGATELDKVAPTFAERTSVSGGSYVKQTQIAAGGQFWEVEATDGSASSILRVGQFGTPDEISLSTDTVKINLQNNDNIKSISDSANYYFLVIEKGSGLKAIGKTHWPAAGGGGGTPSLQDVTDIGNTTTAGIIAEAFNTNDSKVQIGTSLSYGMVNLANTSGMTVGLRPSDDVAGNILVLPPPSSVGLLDTLATLADVRAGSGGGAANLLFDSLGAAGVSPVTVRDDTLMSRRISVTGGLAIDTTATGGIVIDASGVSGGGGSFTPAITVLTSGTTWTTPGDITASTVFKITMAGGGGGGGGHNTTNGEAAGGGAGGALVVYVTGLTASTGYTYAIGSAGTGGTAAPTDGSAGGNTTLTIGATTYTANGGGAGAAAQGGAGGTGGTATNGDINITGQAGSGSGGTASAATPGVAGGSPGLGLGVGGGAQRNTGGSGLPGTGYGAGGGGGTHTSATGGNGTTGVIIIERIN